MFVKKHLPFVQNTAIIKTLKKNNQTKSGTKGSLKELWESQAKSHNELPEVLMNRIPEKMTGATRSQVRLQREENIRIFNKINNSKPLVDNARPNKGVFESPINDPSLRKLMRKTSESPSRGSPSSIHKRDNDIFGSKHNISAYPSVKHSRLFPHGGHNQMNRSASFNNQDLENTMSAEKGEKGSDRSPVMLNGGN